MNCQKFETVASELARGQMMEVELRDEALEHSADCSNCATQLRDEEMLSRELRSLAAEMSSFEAPASLETNLLSAFRQHQVVVPLPVRRDYRRYWLVAVAALILIVFSVIAVRMKSEDRPVAPQQQANNGTPKKEEPQPQSAVAEDSTPKVREEKTEIAPRKQRKQSTFGPDSIIAKATNGRNKSESPILNHPSNEVATDFMPLGYLNVEAVQDGGQIVRVELPRTALVKFGIPVNMDRPNERVKADLLLGMDGMAHAIRFVQDRRVQ